MKIRLYISLFFLIFFLTTGLLFSQPLVIDTTLGSDSLYQLGRFYAFNGERSKARQVLNYMLNKDSLNSDAGVLMGSTYSWDGKYDSARFFLERVLRHKPSYVDAINALINIELWEDNYQKAIVLADNGLKYYPQSNQLKLKKARALYNLKRYDEAKKIVNEVLKQNPEDKEAKKLRDSIGEATRVNKLTLSFSYDYIQPRKSNFYYGSLAFGRKTKAGSIIGRLAYSYRYQGSMEGLQFEIDAYPPITKKIYAYINIGTSWGTDFPVSRFGLELYRKLPWAMELSLGMRYLNFDDYHFVSFDPVETVVIYTGSVGKYFGNYWLSLRPYVTPGDMGWSKSIAATLRRYFASGEDYLSLTAGMGFSPDDRFTYSVKYNDQNQGSVDSSVNVLKSRKIVLGYQTKIFKWTYGSVGFGYVWQEGRYDIKNIYTFDLGLFYYF